MKKTRTKPDLKLAYGIPIACLPWTRACRGHAPSHINTRILSFSELLSESLPTSRPGNPLASEKSFHRAPDHPSPAMTTRTMARDLLPIRILFHATFALVYLPTIALGFTSGLVWGAPDEMQQELPSKNLEIPMDGLISLSALVPLGVFAAM